MLLSKGIYNKFDHHAQKRFQFNLPTLHTQDVQTKAIKIADDQIQYGGIAITSASRDYPLLNDTESFVGNFKYLLFEMTEVRVIDVENLPSKNEVKNKNVLG